MIILSVSLNFTAFVGNVNDSRHRFKSFLGKCIVLTPLLKKNKDLQQVFKYSFRLQMLKNNVVVLNCNLIEAETFCLHRLQPNQTRYYKIQTLRILGVSVHTSVLVSGRQIGPPRKTCAVFRSAFRIFEYLYVLLIYKIIKLYSTQGFV